MGDDVAEVAAAIAALHPLYGTLPPRASPYRLTMGELHETFVAKAPFRERRELVFSALDTFSKCVWEVVPAARLWIDGGFVTHKSWEAPKDADVAIVTDGASVEAKALLASQGLLTMSEATATIREKTLPAIPKLAPFGGLVDAYLAEGPLLQAYFDEYWSQVRGPNGDTIDGARKGYVEVIRGF